MPKMVSLYSGPMPLPLSRIENRQCSSSRIAVTTTHSGSSRRYSIAFSDQVLKKLLQVCCPNPHSGQTVIFHICAAFGDCRARSARALSRGDSGPERNALICCLQPEYQQVNHQARADERGASASSATSSIEINVSATGHASAQIRVHSLPARNCFRPKNFLPVAGMSRQENFQWPGVWKANSSIQRPTVRGGGILTSDRL
jgi:hypothetical protein